MVGTSCAVLDIDAADADVRFVNRAEEAQMEVRGILSEVVKEEMQELKAWIAQHLRDVAWQNTGFQAASSVAGSSSVEEILRQDKSRPRLVADTPAPAQATAPLAGDEALANFYAKSFTASKTNFRSQAATTAAEGQGQRSQQQSPQLLEEEVEKSIEPVLSNGKHSPRAIRGLQRAATKILSQVASLGRAGSSALRMGRMDSRDTRLTADQRRLDWEERVHDTVQRFQSAHRSSKESIPDNALARLVTSQVFSMAIAMAILANAIVIAWDVEDSMHRALDNPGEQKPDFFITANLFFTVLFSAELLLNIVSLRSSFFIGSGWGWNMFDAVLVLISVLEVAEADSDEAGYSRGFVRLLRVVRIARVLRLLRILRFFSELRYMCMSMLSCMASLFWAMVLLLMVVFIFAVVFMHAGVTELEVSRANVKEWRRWYSSLGETILTLTKAISGGEDWALLAAPLEDAHTAYVVLFALFVLLFLYGALNVLTGVFMQRALETMNHDRDWITQHETLKIEKFVTNLTTLFHELDINCAGEITWPDFLQAMENPSTQAFFTSHELDLFDAHLVFNTMARGTGVVNLMEFVQGCSRAAGYAKSAHLMALIRKTETMHRDFKQAFERLYRGLPPFLAGPTPSTQQQESVCTSRPTTVNGMVNERFQEDGGFASEDGETVTGFPI